MREAGSDEDIKIGLTVLTAGSKDGWHSTCETAEMPGMTPPGEHPVFGTAAATSTA